MEVLKYVEIYGSVKMLKIVILSIVFDEKITTTW